MHGSASSAKARSSDRKASDDDGSPSSRLPKLDTPGKSTEEKLVQTASDDFPANKQVAAPKGASTSPLISRSAHKSESPISPRHNGKANYSPSIEFESSAEKPTAQPQLDKKANWSGVYANARKSTASAERTAKLIGKETENVRKSQSPDNRGSIKRDTRADRALSSTSLNRNTKRPRELPDSQDSPKHTAKSA